MSALRCLRETPWETRNLGVTSYAVADAFWEAPDFAALDGEMTALAERHGTLFVSARMGRDGLPLAPGLQSVGFYVVESTVAPVMALNRNPILAEFERDPAAFLPRRYRPEEVRFRAAVERGPGLSETLAAMARSSFSEDRFHRDHRCPAGAADRRFALWMGDLLADPSVAFDLLELREKPVAFFARKGNYLIVSGFAQGATRSGLGEFFWLSVCSAVKAAGHPGAHSLVSCNNLPSLNLCARCGFRFQDTGYTFHCWCGPAAGRGS